VKENFKAEIEQLVDAIPPEQWEDPDRCGLVYDFTPWHQMSCVTIQTRGDDARDIGGWKYYYSAESGEHLEQEFEEYQQAKDWLGYHRLLIEAAEALLEIDFSRFDLPPLVEGFKLYGPFRLQVYHADEIYKFNYCEYVLARRAESG
jgi:hypothetical protein